MTPRLVCFLLEHNQLFEKVTHKWARIIPNWTGEIAIIGTLLSFVWPLTLRRANPEARQEFMWRMPGGWPGTVRTYPAFIIPNIHWLSLATR